MNARGRSLKFTAVIVMVVLALTGFSTGSKGRHHSTSRHGSGGGGGCSSSSQDHDSSSSSTTGGGSYGSSYGDDDDDGYGGSGSSGGSSYTRRPARRATSTPSGRGTAEPLENGTARLVSCATDKRPYATVEVTNPNSRKAEFQVRVTFYDDQGTELLNNGSPVVTVPARGKATTRVTLGERFLMSVDHCAADPEAEVRPQGLS